MDGVGHYIERFTELSLSSLHKTHVTGPGPFHENSQQMIYVRKRAEYGFGEYGFKHRAQWVFWPSPSSGERAQWVPLGLLFVCQSELIEIFAELTEFAPKLSEAQWVLFSETVLCKQYSARFLHDLCNNYSMGCMLEKLFEHVPWPPQALISHELVSFRVQLGEPCLGI